MLITKQSSNSQSSSGTTFFKISLPDLIKMLKDNDGNILMVGGLESEGWRTIDFDRSLFGSLVIDEVLYLCKTDGRFIEVAGEEVDPEYALEECDLTDLAEYIKPATFSDIQLEITPYEVTKFDINEVAKQLLDDGVSLKDITRAAEDYFD